MRPLLEGNDLLQVFAFLYAHAKSRVGDSFLRDLTNVERVRDVLCKWTDELPLHNAQLAALCDKLRELFSDADSVPDPSKKATTQHEGENLPQFIACMCKAFPGVSPEFWLTGISAQDARKMLNSASESGSFAESEVRRSAIADYLRAVKWVRYNHG